MSLVDTARVMPGCADVCRAFGVAIETMYQCPINKTDVIEKREKRERKTYGQRFQYSVRH